MTEPTVIKGEAIKGRWGQWYRHDRVLLNGEEIGRFQIRRRYFGKRFGHRVEAITLDLGNSCVMGCQLGWLVRRASEGGIEA